MIRTYNEMRHFLTFEERFEYLRLAAIVGEKTFGYERYFNQMFYRSREWKYVRNEVIFRDNGCDLAIPDREILSNILVHHINPLSLEDIEEGADCIFDLNNLVTTCLATHNAIHFGDISQLPRLPEVRTKGDTRLWS